jgi:hypothetical protein
MDGAEDENADGATEEFVAMGLQEAAGVLVHAGHVECKSENDGVVAFEAGDSGCRLCIDGETLFEEVIGDGVGNLFGGPVTSGPGDEDSGWHATSVER